LKVFQGSLEPVGTIVLPSLAVVALLALPFIDRIQLRRANRRILAGCVVILAFSVWGTLTAAAVLSSPPGSSSLIGSTRNAQWAELSPEVIAGRGYFNQARCGTCHNVLIGDPKPGPSLASIQVHHPRPWLIQHFKNPGEGQPGQKIAPAQFSLPQLNALALFVENLKPETASKLEDISPKAIQGAQVFVMGGCGGCHKVNSVGGGIGPPLNGLADRRKREWVKTHFVAPQKLSPGTIMPAYHFSAAEEDAIILYLFSLPE
jgi:cytochrome c2